MAIESGRQRIRLLDIEGRLDEYYGRPVWAPRYAPVDELVYTVLSQNTADVNTLRTFAALKARYPDWSATRDAPVEEVVATIGLGGLAATKGPRIQQILRTLSQRSGTPDLSELADMSDGQALSHLQAMPGVGPKTAACVLMFALDRPVMPVDTHVYRVARRLGLLAPEVNVARAHQVLTELAPADDVYAVHVNFVTHGRRICHARRPECGRCPLRDLCPSAARFTQVAGAEQAVEEG
jgi:endonuclease III